MIEVIQAGQFGKTLSLVEMHKLRKVIFKDRMGWDVDINAEGLEIDNYDLPETIYFLVKNDQNMVVGTWRMLPSSSPSMIRDIWPAFLKNFPMPVSNDVWECSRFGVHSYGAQGREHINQVNKTTVKLIWSMVKTCLLADIKYIYTMYNPHVGKSVRKIGFIPEATTEEIPVEGIPSIVGRFRMDQEVLDRIERLTGFKGSLNLNDLPPSLIERVHRNFETNIAEKKLNYA